MPFPKTKPTSSHSYMKTKIQINRLLLAAFVLSVVQESECYAGKTTMTATGGSSVQYNTVAIAGSDSVTLTTTTQNGTITVNYDYSASPGVSGPTIATAFSGSPAVSNFTFTSEAVGQTSTIYVTTTQAGATQPGGGMTPCTHNTSSPSYTIVIPKVVLSNMSGVSGSYQRVPIYAPSNTYEGTSWVTITPAFLPSGTTIKFEIDCDDWGGAQFDNSQNNISLSTTGSLNIRGTSNS